MAKLKAGLIVTEIKGKLGGSTFRETSNGLVISSKSRGGAVGVLQANNSLALIAAINKEFGKLNENEREKWRDLAKMHPYIDTFGDTRYLTGKGLYVKLRSNLKMSNINLIDINNISSYVPIVKVDEIKLELNSSKQIKFVGDDKSVVIRLQIVRVRDLNSAFNNRRNKILKTLNFWLNDTMDFTSEFDARFPYAQENDVYQLSLTAVNSSGFKKSFFYENVKLVNENDSYYLNFTKTAKSFIITPLVQLTNNWSILLDIEIPSGLSDNDLFYQLPTWLRLYNDGRFYFQTNNVNSGFAEAGSIPFNQRGLFFIDSNLTETNFYWDSILIYSIAGNAEFNLGRMFQAGNLYYNFKLFGMSINNQPFDFTLGAGNEITNGTGVVFTLHSDDSINNMWVLNS